MFWVSETWDGRAELLRHLGDLRAREAPTVRVFIRIITADVRLRPYLRRRYSDADRASSAACRPLPGRRL